MSVGGGKQEAVESNEKLTKTVDSFQKNAVEEVRANLDEYRGHQVVDLRVWVDSKEKAGEKVATKKGLTISVDRFPELKRSVLKLEKELVKEKLLDREALQ